MYAVEIRLGRYAAIYFYSRKEIGGVSLTEGDRFASRAEAEKVVAAINALWDVSKVH